MSTMVTRTARTLQSYLFLTGGLALGAAGWAGFIVPAGIIGGGATGMATVLHFLAGLDIGAAALAINLVLIALSIRIIGASFGVKTIYAITVFSLFLSLVSRRVEGPILTETMMAMVTGSILAGVGSGIVFLNGGSTGGSDIIAMIINKYRNISLGRLLLCIDTVIISSSFLLFRSLETMIYGFVCMAILTYTVDLIINGTNETVQFFIFSRRHRELQHHIIHVARRGLTILPGVGGYSGQEVKVLMVIARKSESQVVLRLIKEIDPEAFITMGTVSGVYGQGFDTIKA
ncbi:permease [Alkalispirochaeta sphaeroplastigenens]|uniref:Permease n=1 Tax=Alkalispirochaeta sphaeroplastigenens TaxID=1187066 RepID=A0A2S4JI15_9SPIO|nr:MULTISPECIES: YitT family protein [Alkalispirochaeta]POQ99182.1 permease [Alkalispirochaeta sphaeroplastigenens]